MYFTDRFVIKRHEYKDFQSFFAAVKYYFRRYRNRPDVEIIVDKRSFCVIFKAKGRLRFY